MTKRFIKDNRGQVLYAVIVTVMFISLLAMIAMGLTLKNYHASQQKQQRVEDYYAADAVAELIRIETITITGSEPVYIDLKTYEIVSQEEAASAEAIAKVTHTEDGVYTIVTDTATIVTKIVDKQFQSWEVSYHAVETEAEAEQPPA